MSSRAASSRTSPVTSKRWFSPGVSSPRTGRNERASFWFHRTVHNLPDARVDEGAHAHQARLERDVYVRGGQTVIADNPRGLAEHQHLRMCGRIARRYWLVETARDDRVVNDEHGADRHLAGREREPRLLERSVHERFVRHRPPSYHSGLQQQAPGGRVRDWSSATWSLGFGTWDLGFGIFYRLYTTRRSREPAAATRGSCLSRARCSWRRAAPTMRPRWGAIISTRRL